MGHPLNERLSRKDLSRLGLLVVSTAAVRAVLAALLPTRFYSKDIHIWETVTSELLNGQNPYVTNSLLYYPPFWMQVLFVLGKVSVRTHIPLAHLIQGVLTLVDIVIVILVYLFLRSLGLGRASFWIAFVGIAMNPVSMIMAVEHGNFDAIVGMFSIGSVFALVKWNRGASMSMWLLACMLLGLGILAKTVPVILSPLLLVRWRDTDWAARAVAGALVIGPALLGVSVLYALSPHSVAADIFQYRSAPGYFGISGLLGIAGGDPAMVRYSQIYPALALAVVALATFAVAYIRSLDDATIVLLSVVMLMSIPALGPGYGPQYIGWFLPLLVVLLAISKGFLRVSLITFAAVALVTYLAEYAVIPLQSDSIRSALAAQEAQTLLRVPLFLAYLFVLIAGLAQLSRSRTLDVRGNLAQATT